MGYDIKLYAGTYNKTLDHFQVIGMVDLCVTTYTVKHFWSLNAIPVKIYGIDTNQYRVYDNYGDKIKAIPLNVMIGTLRILYENTKYRRYKIALAMLEAIQETFNESVYVALFGH